MRIVAGRHRGRSLKTPADLAVRPTADRTREALFNILTSGKLSEEGGQRLPGARVLDAFAGTGALGLEALSRGAAQVTFMENYAPAIEICRANIKALGEEERADLLACDVLHPVRPPAPCDLVFLDPPYNQGLAEKALVALDKAGWIAGEALVSVELMKTEDFALPQGFTELDNRTYGKARLVFLKSDPAPPHD
ncbi:16S rRNA (guanine(966)-N(2))-methyltransferase RsmD [Pelagibius sp.]|uniref:16S rRNA (guanine(966)-N(2))-methyltransferase RsmD n=1 Tax=Pelagibius sp. TaxID=1931238 RepID=UPI00260D1416|nr:16S rRNA (guanine(966)-N(2))-methyltransferase RsmD [Pelagibius sp.]